MLPKFDRTRYNRAENVSFVAPHVRLLSLSDIRSRTSTVHRRSRPRVTCVHPSSPPTLSRRQALLLFSLLSPALLRPNLVVFAQSPSEELNELTFEKLPCPDEQCRAVEYHDYRVGTGKPVQQGSTVVLKWTGRLADRYGWPIQNEQADELRITVGKDRLIKGFEMALMGMREGGKRRMLIPSELGYLDERSGPLPASYGDRRRLFATVLNQRRFKRAGDLVIDVQLLKRFGEQGYPYRCRICGAEQS